MSNCHCYYSGGGIGTLFYKSWYESKYIRDADKKVKKLNCEYFIKYLKNLELIRKFDDMSHDDYKKSIDDMFNEVCDILPDDSELFADLMPDALVTKDYEPIKKALKLCMERKKVDYNIVIKGIYENVHYTTIAKKEFKRIKSFTGRNENEESYSLNLAIKEMDNVELFKEVILEAVEITYDSAAGKPTSLDVG